MLHQNMPAGATVPNPLRPLHILVCPDQPSWSFDNIAGNISRHAGANRVSKLYMRDVIGNEHRLFETIFLKRIDVCHVFWREDLFHLFNPETVDKVARSMGLDHEMLARAINSCAFTTSVYDHLFSDPAEIQLRRPGFAMTDGYTVSSQRLHRIYSVQPDIPGPDAIITDGVDTERFTPRDEERKPGAFAIGWVGNSAWGKATKGFDVKGFGRLFEPMMSVLSARGLDVEARVADPRVRQIGFEDMPDFYRQLDVFVCTSAMEGTPNPVLEAMASGLPVVSTDVGIVPEVFGDLQRRFMLDRTDPETFADAVAELLGDAKLRAAIGEENRRQALQWSWENTTRAWWPFWQDVVRRTMDPRNAARRELYIRSLAGGL